MTNIKVQTKNKTEKIEESKNVSEEQIFDEEVLKVIETARLATLFDC